MSDEITIEKDYFKRVFHNRYTAIFSVFFIATLLVVLFKGVNFVSSFAVFSKIYSTFSTPVLLLLAFSFLLSAICAHYKKYKLMFLPLIIWILLTTAIIRTSNIDQLKDVTTGDYTLGPDLDPFLYLRHAIEISEGRLQNPDMMRQAPLGYENYATKSLMPWGIFYMYKFVSIFKPISVTYAAIISPVIFFLISAIGFLLFVKAITSFKFSKNKSWIISIIATLLYVSSPEMLHRTVAGIPEIESLGMIGFWFALLFFTLAWKTEKKNKRVIFGVLSGILTGLMIWSWGGYRYIFLSFALTTFLMFLFSKERQKNFVVYTSWIIPSIILIYLKTQNISSVLTSISDTGPALVIFFVLIADYILVRMAIKKYSLYHKIKLPESIKNLIIVVIVLALILLIIKPNLLINSVSSLLERILYPFGKGRIGLTVAENKVPYLTEVIASFGNLLWLFLIGVLFLFYKLTEHFRKDKKILLNISFLLVLACLVFTRFSPTSWLNEDNFVSKLLYVGSLIFFVIEIFYVYIKSKDNDEKTSEAFENIDFSIVLLLGLALLSIISFKGAVRLFFIISPLLVIFPSILVVGIFDSMKNAKGDLSKFTHKIVVVIIVILLFFLFVNNVYATAQETKATIPSSYTQQWQKAMSWVRESTPKNSIFVHWWDYGYWVQTIGERPTVTDGGHANSWWDHTTARYLMTTPKPEAALSLMKTYNVSYLLIDSTDIGKYSAFSSIGSDKDNQDRLSWITTLVSDPKQTQETANGTIRIYQGGTVLDEDIVDNSSGKEVFLPAGKAGLAGIILNSVQSNSSVSFSQPEAVFVYNGNQYKIPARYIYFEGKIIDFKKGLDAIFYIIPSIYQSSQGYQIDRMGAAFYLSKKTAWSLLGQLYILNDPFSKYSTLKLVHSEQDPFVDYLNTQGAGIKDFVYFNGVRGPIKIWQVSYLDNVIAHKEFLDSSGEYGELDDFEFTR